MQTVSLIYSFFLAMTLYPEIQKRAQAQIDHVIGTNRLPSFQDRDNLPYVDALMKEVYRWNPVAPLGECLLNRAVDAIWRIILGVPHRLTEDDEYEGHLIPKGSVVVANIW